MRDWEDEEGVREGEREDEEGVKDRRCGSPSPPVPPLPLIALMSLFGSSPISPRVIFVGQSVAQSSADPVRCDGSEDCGGECES